EAMLANDPLLEVVSDEVEPVRRGKPVWSSRAGVIAPSALGQALAELRREAGWDLAEAVARSKGTLTAETIERIERTGACDVRELIALADVYTASLDLIVDRTVVRGSRRQR